MATMGVCSTMRMEASRLICWVASTPFMTGVDRGPVLRFCFAKRADTLERAAERLRNV